MSIRKSDIIDADIVDAYELISDGYNIYLTTPLVSTDSVTQTVIITMPPNGEGLTSIDNPAQDNDVVFIVGSSAADGYYSINSIIDDLTFTVDPPIPSSTGGTIYFMYRSGALNVGFNPIGKIDISLSSTNVQDAINDLDQNKLDKIQHEKLRQLIHFLSDGPGDNFSTNPYREILPAGNPFPTSVVWYMDNTKSKKIVEKLIMGGIFPTSIVWNMYDVDGVTIIESLTDVINYSGPFEISRTRTITI